MNKMRGEGKMNYKKDITEILESCTMDYFGKAKHKYSPEKLLKTSNVLLLDVRSHEEFESIAIPLKVLPNIEFKHIPISELVKRIDEIPQNKNIAVFCPANFRSTLAYVYLKMKGFESVRILSGGYQGLTEILMPGKLYKHLYAKKE